MSHTVLYLERTIDSSHIIPGHPGKCGRLHGHTYRFEVWLSGPVAADDGMVVDFFNVKEMIDEWDHIHLNDVVSYTPTAELLAADMQRRLLALLIEGGDPSPQGAAGFGCVVRLWETPNAYAQVGELTRGDGEPVSLAAVPDEPDSPPPLQVV